LEAAIDRLREHLGGGGLGQTRHALEQYVAPREQTDQQRLLQVALPDDLGCERVGNGIYDPPDAVDFALIRLRPCCSHTSAKIPGRRVLTPQAIRIDDQERCYRSRKLIGEGAPW
jgi:hypothetical protein